MIEEESLVSVGKFQRTHALKGELNAILDIDGDFFDEDYPLVVCVDGLYVPFYTEGIRPKGATSWLLKLRSVNSEQEAKSFVNKIIYVRRDDLKEFTGEDFTTVEDLEGYEVIDSRFGLVGKLEGIDDSTENELFIVRRADGSEVFVPVVDEFVKSIDSDMRRIDVAIPDGLLDLNSGNAQE